MGTDLVPEAVETMTMMMTRANRMMERLKRCSRKRAGSYNAPVLLTLSTPALASVSTRTKSTVLVASPMLLLVPAALWLSSCKAGGSCCVHI
jgi:hypothetical protein